MTKKRHDDLLQPKDLPTGGPTFKNLLLWGFIAAWFTLAFILGGRAYMAWLPAVMFCLAWWSLVD